MSEIVGWTCTGCGRPLTLEPGEEPCCGVGATRRPAPLKSWTVTNQTGAYIWSSVSVDATGPYEAIEIAGRLLGGTFTNIV